MVQYAFVQRGTLAASVAYEFSSFVGVDQFIRLANACLYQQQRVVFNNCTGRCFEYQLFTIRVLVLWKK